jgi:type I restriction enzyme M protein
MTGLLRARGTREAVCDVQRISQLCWMFFLKIIDDQELELTRDNYSLPIPNRFQW